MEKKLCEVGDIMWKCDTGFQVYKTRITSVKYINSFRGGHFVYRDEFGRSYFDKNFNKNIFFTEDDAQKEANKRSGIVMKKKMLREYEEQLNKQFGIVDHRWVK